MDIPPKNTKEKDFYDRTMVESLMKKYDGKYKASMFKNAEEFNKTVSFLLENTEEFEKYNSNISEFLFAEFDIEEYLDDREYECIEGKGYIDTNEETIKKQYQKALSMMSNFLEPVIKSYEGGSFTYKKNLISLCTGLLGSAIFANGQTIANVFARDLREKIQNEKKEDENYFLSLWVENLQNNQHRDVHSKEIAPKVFLYQKLVDYKRVPRVSRPEDFQDVVTVQKEMEDLENEYTKLQTSKKSFAIRKLLTDELGERLHMVREKYENYFADNNLEHQFIISNKKVETLGNMIYDLSFFTSNHIQNKFENDFGVRLNFLPLADQVYFLDYIKSKTRREMKKVMEFTKQFKVDGIRTFLALEQGGREMGDKILELGAVLPRETAEVLFKKYSEIVDIVAVLSEDALGKVSKNDTHNSPEMVITLRERMMEKGKQLLSAYGQKVKNGSLDIDRMKNDLDELKIDTEMFRTFYKLAKEREPETSLEDFSGMEIVKKNTIDFDDGEIQEMRQIIAKNYRDNEKLLEKVMESFTKALSKSSDQTEFFVLKRDGRVVAFDRLDNNDDGSAYFGSFNVDPAYCSSKIGDSFFQATILPQMDKRNIRADCSLVQPIGAYYIESGFIGTGMYNEGGEPSLHILSDQKQKLSSKLLSRGKIIAGKIDENIRVLKNTLQSDFEKIELQTGEVISRYFFDKESQLWYMVIEKLEKE